MDIALYLRRKGAALALLVLLPTMAGVLAFLALRDQPTMEVASLRVPVPESFARGFTEVNLFVENFQESLRSTGVTRAATDQLPLSQQAYRQGISAERVGDAATVRVRFEREVGGPVDADPAAVVRTAAGLVLAELTATDLALVEEEHAAAQAELDAAEQRWAQFAEATGLGDIDRELGAALDDRRSLQIQIANVASRGDDPGLLARLEELLAATEQRITEVRAALPEAQRIERRLERASGLVEEVQRDLLETRARVTRAGSDEALGEVAVNRRTDATAVRDGVLVAVVTGLLLAAAVLVLPDLWRQAGARQAALVAREREGRAGPVEGSDAGTVSPDEPPAAAENGPRSRARRGTSRRSDAVPARGGWG